MNQTLNALKIVIKAHPSLHWILRLQKEPYIHITEVGYTAVWFTDSGIRTHSCVIELDSMSRLSIVRLFNQLPATKIMQNGKYDLAYLARYNAAPETIYGILQH